MVCGLSYKSEDVLISILSNTLREKFPNTFSRIDKEYPLIQLKDSPAAKYGAHIPNTFHLELITNHAPLSDQNDIPEKIKQFRDMRREIDSIITDFSLGEAFVTWSPRPITNVLKHMKRANKK